MMDPAAAADYHAALELLERAREAYASALTARHQSETCETCERAAVAQDRIRAAERRAAHAGSLHALRNAG